MRLLLGTRVWHLITVRKTFATPCNHNNMVLKKAVYLICNLNRFRMLVDQVVAHARHL
jgi:hypothetical protein